MKIRRLKVGDKIRIACDLDMGRYYWYADAVVGVNKYE